MSDAATAHELDVRLDGLEAWQALKRAEPWVAAPESAPAIAAHAARHGIVSRHLGRVEPAEIEIAGPNLREQFRARGLNPRVRAVLECLEEELVAIEASAGDRKRTQIAIYAPEAVTPFARHMEAQFPGFVGSEFLPDAEARARFPAVEHQDLEALSFEDARFDVVLCNEVFEHLPDLPRALAEIRRVLRPEGALVASFPFAYERTESIVKAKQRDGRIEHLGEPEYHDDPVAQETGALVYRIPGWEILEQTREAGFDQAHMRFIASTRRGLCARDLAGVFLLEARV